MIDSKLSYPLFEPKDEFVPLTSAYELCVAIISGQLTAVESIQCPTMVMLLPLPISSILSLSAIYE